VVAEPTENKRESTVPGTYWSKFDVDLRTSSRSRQLKNTIFARVQRLVLNNFRRSSYISTEDLLPTKEAWTERIHFRLQDAIEVEL
jgi:hypothetical protein